MSEELKPCPFCGGKGEMCETKPSTARFNEGAVNFAVQCFAFDCQGVKANCWGVTPEDAADMWNTRAQQSDWISVDDRLPELCLRVLAYDKGGFGWVSARLQSAGWYLEGELDANCNITHWQPLPAEPESRR